MVETKLSGMSCIFGWEMNGLFIVPLNFCYGHSGLIFESNPLIAPRTLMKLENLTNQRSFKTYLFSSALFDCGIKLITIINASYHFRSTLTFSWTFFTIMCNIKKNYLI